MKHILFNRTYWGYSTYDFSNSGFVLIFQSFLLPVFFLSIFPEALDAEFSWSIVVAFYSIISIILSPIVGAFGDRSGRASLFATLIFCAGIMTFYAVSNYETVAILMVAFVIAAVAFELSQVIYDSFLPELEIPERRISLSSFAWGIGYLGGAFFAVCYLLVDDRLEDVRILQMFAVLYVLFSLPAIWFFCVRSKKKQKKANTSRAKFSSATSSRRTEKPRREISHKKTVQSSPVVGWKNLFIIWAILQSAVVSFSFASIYMSKYIGMSTTQIGVYVLCMQLLAVILTPVIGFYSEDRPMIVLRLCLLGWLVFLLGLLALTVDSWIIWALVILGAALVGSTQAIVRGLFARQVIEDVSGVQFGYFAIAQKGAALTGPGLVTLILAFGGNLSLVYVLLGCLIIAAIGISFKMAPW